MKWVSRKAAVTALAWVVVIVAFANALRYVLRTSNPVLRSDAWYFFDVFVRKAIDGTLGVADFFVKRHGMDHAQPLFKVVLWMEWRFFDLDMVFGAIVGVVAALGCGLILRRWAVANQRDLGANVRQQFAWCAMCALLFSLNAEVIWTWPLVTMGYLSVLLVLVFIWATWRAVRSGRSAWLVAATLLMCGAIDDSAVIAVVAVIVALLVASLHESEDRRRNIWRACTIIVGCLIVARVVYRLAPVVGGAPGPTLAEDLSHLWVHVRQEGLWQWASTPLALSVAYNKPFVGMSDHVWRTMQWVIAALVGVAHLAFWWRAFRAKHNLATFSSVCLMLLTYAWIAGIVVYRVSLFGADYLQQARYVGIYVFNLIALLLMWAGSERAPQRGLPRVAGWLPAVGCALLLGLQIPISNGAWQQRPYLLAYYKNMALQIEALARDPATTTDCGPLLEICGWSLEPRTSTLQVLRSHRLNVFSPRVQAWHSHLPRLSEESPADGRSTHKLQR